VAPQSGVKNQVYSTVYNIALNPICMAQRASNFFNVEDRVRNKNE
jgi:hypothetical protein